MKLSRTILITTSLLGKALAAVVIFAFTGLQATCVAAPPPRSHAAMIPLSPQGLLEEAAVYFIKQKMGNVLPLQLDPTQAFQTVQNAQLPGGPFQGKPLPLTVANVSKPLPPGDYLVPVLPFCTQYSVHRPGRGTATVLAPITGTQAQTLGNLIWKGIQAGRPIDEIQTTSWKVQGGVPYSQMSKESQADMDAFAPGGRASLEQGFAIDTPVRQLYNDIVVNPRKYILEYKHAKGIKFPPDIAIPSIKLTVPSFDQVVAQLGPVGHAYVQAEVDQRAILQQSTDQQHQQENLLLHQAPTDPPLPPSEGPWTVRVPNVAYMRFIVQSGWGKTDNVMQIRILPKAGSYDDARLRRPHFVNASYHSQLQLVALAPSVLELMGVSLAPAAEGGAALAGATGLGGLVVGGALISYGLVPSQALMLALPIINGLTKVVTSSQTVAKGMEKAPQKLYHYTDQASAEQIQQCGCLRVTPSFGKRLVSGAYATTIAPYDDWTQQGLSREFYGGDPSRTMSWYVEIDNSEGRFRSLAYQGYQYQWVADAPTGTKVEVKVNSIGKNPMSPQ